MNSSPPKRLRDLSSCSRARVTDAQTVSSAEGARDYRKKSPKSFADFLFSCGAPHAPQRPLGPICRAQSACHTSNVDLHTLCRPRYPRRPKSGSESVSTDARRQLVGFRRFLASPNRSRPDSFARTRLRSRAFSDETLITANYASGPLKALRDLARSPAISR